MTVPNPSLHFLLLLSDSALPLGSFAFSSGLESFLAHQPKTEQLASFHAFLRHSLSNTASTALPYVLSAYHHPENLDTLANDFDASTPCTVARRASIAQGKALLTLWDRALGPPTSTAGEALTIFAAALKTPDPWLNAHFPPLFGVVCRTLGLNEAETKYLFLLNHAKTLLSAAVRSGVMGPYQSHKVLSSEELRGWVERECEAAAGGMGGHQEAAVTVPAMDLWMGRHEVLYSRIFNS